jgi:hypothetical protein
MEEPILRSRLTPEHFSKFIMPYMTTFDNKKKLKILLENIDVILHLSDGHEKVKKAMEVLAKVDQSKGVVIVKLLAGLCETFNKKYDENIYFLGLPMTVIAERFDVIMTEWFAEKYTELKNVEIDENFLGVLETLYKQRKASKKKSKMKGPAKLSEEITKQP